MKNLVNYPQLLIVISAILVFIGATQRLNDKDGSVWLALSLLLFGAGAGMWLKRKQATKHRN